MATSKTNTGSRSKSTRNPQGAGRTPSLTKEIQEVILTNLRIGITWERCARLAGVHPDTVKNWKDRGLAAREKIPSKRDVFDNKCLQFLAAFESTEDEWVRRCEVVLSYSMEPGSSAERWKSATPFEKDRAVATSKFKLTHQLSDEYSTRVRTQLAGKNGGPVDLTLTNGEDVFKILLDAIAYEDAQGANN